MAWIDDRIWCHPKFAPLSSGAFSAYVKGLAYSSGMATRGHLSPPVQKLVGAGSRVRSELVAAGLWDVNGDGESVVIHDWDEHNAKRDQRRAVDRERKRRQRVGITEGEWAKTRRAVFARDGGFCADCGKQDEHWHADHIPDRETLREQEIPLTDIDYIQTRCTSCHSKRTNAND